MTCVKRLCWEIRSKNAVYSFLFFMTLTNGLPDTHIQLVDNEIVCFYASTNIFGSIDSIGWLDANTLRLYLRMRVCVCVFLSFAESMLCCHRVWLLLLIVTILNWMCVFFWTALELTKTRVNSTAFHVVHVSCQSSLISIRFHLMMIKIPFSSFRLSIKWTHSTLNHLSSIWSFYFRQQFKANAPRTEKKPPNHCN